MTDGRGDEPDRVHRWKPSRRRALALGAGMLGSLAGCSSLSEALPGSAETTAERPSVSESVEASAEYAIDEVAIEVDIGRDTYEDSYWEREGLAGTLRLYAAANLAPSEASVIAEKSIEQTDAIVTHTLDVSEWDLGYAQQPHFTIELTESEEEGEHDLYTPNEMVLPFHNAAAGREQVRAMGARVPTQRWTSGDTEEELAIAAEIWFNEPEEKLFDTPEVPESEYDPDWYPYRDIEVTVVVEYPSYENITRVNEYSGGEVSDFYHVPLMDAVAFTFTLGEWELLEAFRWNSVATHKLEQGVREYGDAGGLRGETDDPEQMGSMMESLSRKFEMDAASTIPFWRAYRGSRYTDIRNLANPLKSAAGRPVTRRIAGAMEDALDNPSFNTHDYRDYHKAIALEVFVGWNPYSFAGGSYSYTPEEAINRWFLHSRDESNGVGTCQDGTFLYCSIAAHLLDANPGYVSLVANDIAHATAGLFDLQMPEEPFEIWSDNHPSSIGVEPFALETEYGSLSVVECTYPDPMIGWKLWGASEEELETYLSETSHETHIPLNDEYEPDRDGGPTEDYYEIPWEYHENNDTIGDIDDVAS